MSTKKVCTDIPEELHQKITLYNMSSVRKINMAKVMMRALEEEVSKIGKELVSKIDDDFTPRIVHCNLRWYEKLLEFIKENPDNLNDRDLTEEVFSMVSDLYFDIISSRSMVTQFASINDTKDCVPLYPIDKFEIVENDGLILSANGKKCIKITYI
jgi:hypothetical protein